MPEAARERLITTGAIFALAVFNVYHQVSFMDFQGGLAWYERVQWERTQAVMAGEQGTPWQYRLFTDGIVYATVRAFEATGVPRPVGSAFVLIRLLQNLLFFTLALPGTPGSASTRRPASSGSPSWRGVWATGSTTPT